MPVSFLAVCTRSFNICCSVQFSKTYSFSIPLKSSQGLEGHRIRTATKILLRMSLKQVSIEERSIKCHNTCLATFNSFSRINHDENSKVNSSHWVGCHVSNHVKQALTINLMTTILMDFGTSTRVGEKRRI